MSSSARISKFSVFLDVVFRGKWMFVEQWSLLRLRAYRCVCVKLWGSSPTGGGPRNIRWYASFGKMPLNCISASV